MIKLPLSVLIDMFQLLCTDGINSKELFKNQLKKIILEELRK